MSLGLTEGAVNEFYSIIGGIDASLDKIHRDLVNINATLAKLVEATSLTELEKQNIAYNKRFSHDYDA